MWAFQVPQYLSEVCATFAATLSCVVMHEIYACVTCMKMRQPDVGHLAKLIAACGLLSSLVAAFNYLHFLVASLWWKLFFSTGHTITSLVALVACISGTYMGVRAVAALLQSRNMIASSNGGQRKKWHIYATILVIVVAQWFQLICDVVKAIMVNVREGHAKCDEKQLSLADIQECQESYDRNRDLSLRLHRSMAGLLESFGFTCVMIGKKCLQDTA